MTGIFVHPSQRYRLYFDETGTGDRKAHLKDQNQRYLSLTGLVFRQDAHDGAFTRRLDAFKTKIFNDPSVILHRRDIMAKKGPFEILKDDAKRAEFDAHFADLIEYVPAPVFTVSIDKKAHIEKYKVWQFDPYHYVLTCLVERYVLWLKRNGYRGDVMGEGRGPWHDTRLRKSFRLMHANGSEFVKPKVVQAHLISKELRLEPKTSNVAGLQVADLLAHPSHRSYKFGKLGIPIPDDYGASLARVLLDVYDRHPRHGTIEGCGRKWLP